MLKEGRGVLCAALPLSLCKTLGLTPQTEENTSILGTPFTVMVDKIEGCTTGVSASDRAATIQALADPSSIPVTFGKPGHICPLYDLEDGLLRRGGPSAAAVVFDKLSSFRAVAAFIEIMSVGGSFARLV